MSTVQVYSVEKRGLVSKSASHFTSEGSEVKERVAEMRGWDKVNQAVEYSCLSYNGWQLLKCHLFYLKKFFLAGLFFFSSGPGFKLRALHLLGRHPTA
jgi:hypothetical protein